MACTAISEQDRAIAKVYNVAGRATSAADSHPVLHSTAKLSQRQENRWAVLRDTWNFRKFSSNRRVESEKDIYTHTLTHTHARIHIYLSVGIEGKRMAEGVKEKSPAREKIGRKETHVQRTRERKCTAQGTRIRTAKEGERGLTRCRMKNDKLFAEIRRWSETRC